MMEMVFLTMYGCYDKMRMELAYRYKVTYKLGAGDPNTLYKKERIDNRETL